MKIPVLRSIDQEWNIVFPNLCQTDHQKSNALNYFCIGVAKSSFADRLHLLNDLTPLWYFIYYSYRNILILFIFLNIFADNVIHNDITRMHVEHFSRMSYP